MADFLESYVNLYGYSSSKGFLGFLEGVKDNRLEASKQIIKQLADWVYSDVEAFSIATSLHFPRSRRLLNSFFGSDGIDYEEYLEFESRGLLFSVSAEGFFDDIPDGQVGGSELRCRSFSHLVLSQFERNLIEKILFATMNRDGLYGHFFIGSITRGVVLYPHDDVGFGFILTPDSRASQRIFRLIREAVSSGNFRFVRASEIPD